MLQPLYGGALARPFITHHNALDRDLYLRIATELYLKRCIVGGIERVYELGKDFRNEGISLQAQPRVHDARVVRGLRRLPRRGGAGRAARRLTSPSGVLGTTKIERDGTEIDLAPPWHRVTLRDAIEERTGLDLAERPSREELAAAMGGEPDAAEGWGKLVDGVLSKLVEPELVQPTFVLDYPVELSPFAKRHRSAEGLVERFEAFVGGVEIANAFTELNDPDEQRRRFEQQREELQRGDEEAQPFDEAFLEALEHGMPPTAGVGLGIDRLVMVLDRGAQPARGGAVPGDADVGRRSG